MATRPYRLGYVKDRPFGGYRGHAHFSRSTYATIDAATAAARESLAGRRTWGPDRAGFVYVAVVVYRDGERVCEVTC